MTFKEAQERCHVRAAIFRKAKPDSHYSKNHSMSFDDRVSEEDQQATDWEEYDPRDHDDCSLFMYND